MSYYCSFEYKGIVKPKYRRDIETAVSKGNWTAVQSEELKILFKNWDDYGLIFISSRRKPFENDYFRYDPDSGLLEIKYTYNYISDNYNTEKFLDTHLPFITEKIIFFHEWEENLYDTGKEYNDVTEDFMLRINECNRKYEEKGTEWM